MARFDSADLLAALYQELRRPTTDQFLTTAVGYTALTEAQEDLYRQVANIAPQYLYGAPVALTTADGGATYTFPGGVAPFGHVEVYASLTGAPLTPGSYFDPDADFTFEGDRIRFPGGRSRQGPYYARFVAPPGAIDAANQPTIKPPFLRVLLPLYAAVSLAAPLKLDPAPYREKIREKWHGEPETGRYGLLHTLRTALFNDYGAVDSDRWWTGLDAAAVDRY